MNSNGKELSEFFLEKARKDLREDETRKRQSLDQMKEWVMKHPFIKPTDPSLLTDDIFLPFLRAKKYRMDKAYESIEKITLFVKHHKNWSDWKGENLKRAMDLYDTGFVTVLKERDYEGRRVIFTTNPFDTVRFNSDDVFRLHVLLFASLHNEEETQIAGAIYIDDLSPGITMNYLAAFPLKHLYDLAVQLTTTPVRLRHILLVGLPSFAAHVVNMMKLGFTETLNKRMQAVNEVSELSSFIDISLLPKEVGGKIPKSEMLEDFKPWMLHIADKMGKFFDSLDVDFSRVDKYKEQYQADQVGSFRKLEID